jgi:hypothetical protein
MSFHTSFCWFTCTCNMLKNIQSTILIIKRIFINKTYHKKMQMFMTFYQYKIYKLYHILVQQQLHGPFQQMRILYEAFKI